MNKNLLYIAAAAYFIWLFSKKKVSGYAPSAQAAAGMAKKIVANAVDQTTFLPDETTFADMYAKDKKECR